MEAQSDYEWAICCTIMVFPVITKCNHIFCRSCINGYLESSPRKQCPMCRTKIYAQDFDPKVVSEIWSKIKASFPIEIEERMTAEKLFLEKENSLQKIDIKFGNFYTLLEDFTKLRNGHENKHEWKIYVKVADKNIYDSELIRSVEFELDESFGSPFIKKLSPPYEFKCKGWGTFEIPIKITWQRWLKLPPTELTHELVFLNNGGHEWITIKVDKQEYYKKSGVKGKLTGIQRLVKAKVFKV